MDGGCRQLEVGPDATIARLPIELERSRALPNFYGVQLSFGNQELKDDISVTFELQAVDTVEPDELDTTIVTIHIRWRKTNEQHKQMHLKLWRNFASSRTWSPPPSPTPPTPPSSHLPESAGNGQESAGICRNRSGIGTEWVGIRRNWSGMDPEFTCTNVRLCK